ncbi:MAG: nucleotidyltransferase domain-containing protein [Nanoarchaeota archaeon]
MDKRLSETLRLLVEEVFPKIKELLVVFAYGSAVRGDYSPRHSDLDLFIVLRKKKVAPALTEKINRLLFSLSYKSGVKIHPEYQSLNITYEDQSLVRKMIEEGKIIYSTGVFSFGTELIGLKQYVIYDFSLHNAINRTMFSKVLHGRKSWYRQGKKKIIKSYPGVLDGEKMIGLGKGTLMVAKDKEKELLEIFGNFAVEYKLKKVVYG